MKISIDRRDSIFVFLSKGDSVVVECSYRELEECFPKI